MTKSEAIQHYGKAIKLARALQRDKSTVSNWDEKLPRGVQFELQVKTGGALQASRDFFNQHQEA